MSSNLLREEWTVTQLSEILSSTPRGPLLPPLGTEPWKLAQQSPLARAWGRAFRDRAEAQASAPLPEASDELYSLFSRTGERLAFENIYFERRRRLGMAAITLLLAPDDDPERGKWIASLTAKLEALFEDISWALPAHVADSSGKDARYLDLFSSETANLMAEAIDLFFDVLPEALVARIRKRLRTDIFENYLENDFFWNRNTNNWNAVCHQGILGAALSQLDDDLLLARMLERARAFLPCFLRGFADDGGTSEGPGYWVYGFGRFATLNEQLELRTQGRLSLFEGDAHMGAIARFGPRMTLSHGTMVNFSDAHSEGRLTPFLLAYLGRRMKEPECLAMARENYRDMASKEYPMDAQRSDLFDLTRLLLNCPASLEDSGGYQRSDHFFSGLGVVVAHGTDSKGSSFSFAAKAGHNNEHHNHNDCGSYLLHIDGVRLVAEIGAPEYVKEFFSPKRYEFFAARSLGHSVPLINGMEQAVGGSHAAHVFHHALGADTVELEMEAGACYPEAARCRQFRRLFRFHKNTGVLSVQDDFILDEPQLLENAVISVHPAAVKNGVVEIDGGPIRLTVRPEPGTLFSRIEKHSYRNHKGIEVKATRIVFVPERLMSNLHMGVEMSRV